MRKIILLCGIMAYFPFQSFANVTVAQAETAMHIAEQDKSKLNDAENILQQAVKENPDSYKANAYLSQILKAEKSPLASIYEYKAAKIKSHEQSVMAIHFAMWLFTLIIIGGALAFFGNNYIQKRRQRENEAMLEAEASSYIRKFVDARKLLQDLVLDLELKDVRFNNKVYADIKELQSCIVDIIERLHEGHEWSISEAEDLLRQVTNCINYCEKKFP